MCVCVHGYMCGCVYVCIGVYGGMGAWVRKPMSARQMSLMPTCGEGVYGGMGGCMGVCLNG